MVNSKLYPSTSCGSGQDASPRLRRRVREQRVREDEVRDVLEEGERVVSAGAYAVRLAAAGTQVPAHGHHH